MRKYIPIKKELCPYVFNVMLRGELIEFEIRYNSDYDFFTMDIARNEEYLIYGEKLVMDINILEGLGFEDLAITPKDLTEQEDRVTYENLSEQVYLYVDGDIDA